MTTDKPAASAAEDDVFSGVVFLIGFVFLPLLVLVTTLILGIGNLLGVISDHVPPSAIAKVGMLLMVGFVVLVIPALKFFSFEWPSRKSVAVIAGSFLAGIAAFALFIWFVGPF
jgi:hypothetical protein